MGIHILVVEDEVTVNQSISEFITELGKPYTLVGSASNGIQALDYFDKHPVHILLTDIRMPQMDGLKLIEEVRKNYKDTKIIILSGYNDFYYAKMAMQNGVVDYLLKPLKKEELTSRLVKVASELYQNTHSYTSLMLNQEKWDMSMTRIESKLFDQIEMGDIEGTKESIVMLLNAFKELAGNDLLRIIPFIIDSLLAINKRLSSVNDIHLYLDSRKNELKEVLVPQRSLIDIEKSVIDFFVYCAQVIKNSREQSSPDVLHRCQDILNNYFEQDITLVEMGRLTGVTPSYLSRLFKKDLGVNYTEYVNQLRMNKAKELLNVPHLKMMEIANMVGFNNANYFAKIFKRYEGMTPNEYHDQRMASHE